MPAARSGCTGSPDIQWWHIHTCGHKKVCCVCQHSLNPTLQLNWHSGENIRTDRSAIGSQRCIDLHVRPEFVGSSWITKALMPLTDPPNPKIWSTSQISLFTLIYIENIANIGNKPNPKSVNFREAQCQTTWVQKKSQFFHDKSRFVSDSSS